MSGHETIYEEGSAEAMAHEEDVETLGQSADPTEEEIQLFEDSFADIKAMVEELEFYDERGADERVVSLAAAEVQDTEDEPDVMAAAAKYRVVDLRGRFCPGWSSWGNSGKSYGVVAHYNGGPAPPRAWSNPIAWIAFLTGLHDDPGRFAPGFRLNGIAYTEFVLGRTVYRTRNYAADLTHCGNLAWNRNSIGMHIPIGGYQRPRQAGRGTLWTFRERAEDHLRAMGHGNRRTGLRGHREVGSSLCPGTHIMSGIRAFRAGK